MSPGGYIAQIPLKYFKNMSLDLFQGKLIRGRVVSSDSGMLRIELGGAQLEAKTSKVLNKGDTVILRVNSITKNGVKLEIVDTIPRSPKASNAKELQTQSIPKPVENSEVANLKKTIKGLFELTSSKAGSTAESNLNNLLRSVLEPGLKHNFFFIAIPISLDDGRRRDVELLMRKIAGDDADTDNETRELIFSVATPRLGDISGKILTVGKRMRVDLVASSQSAISELESISEPIKQSLEKLGFNVTSFRIRQGLPLSSIEYHLENM